MEPLPSCPFCGWDLPTDDEDMMLDVLYPSGTWWADQMVGGKLMRVYRNHYNRHPGDQKCWEINCTANMGGCGARLTADTKEEVIAKWSRRHRRSILAIGTSGSGVTEWLKSLGGLYLVRTDPLESGLYFDQMEEAAKDFCSSHGLACTTNSPLLLNWIPEDVARESIVLVYSNGRRSKRFYDFRQVRDRSDLMGPGEILMDIDIDKMLTEESEEKQK